MKRGCFYLKQYVNSLVGECGYSGPCSPLDSASVDSTNQWMENIKNTLKKIQESSKKQNLDLLHTNNYWHSIDIVLGIRSHLDITWLQARLQQCVNQELPNVQAGFRKGRGTRDEMANIHWLTEKTTELQKNIYFSFIDYAKGFDSWITTNWKILFFFFLKILKKMGLPDHLTWFLRNLFSGKEATVRIGHGTMD